MLLFRLPYRKYNKCMHAWLLVGLQLLAFKYIFVHNSYKSRILYIKVTFVYKIQINILEYSQNLREKYKKVTKKLFYYTFVLVQ